MTDQRALSVLMLTSEWPRAADHTAHFVQRQVRYLEAAGVRVEVFPFRGAKSPMRYASAWLRARRRLARRDFDLVHAQFGQSALLAIPKHLPLVITFRGDDLLGGIGSDGRRARAAGSCSACPGWSRVARMRSSWWRRTWHGTSREVSRSTSCHPESTSSYSNRCRKTPRARGWDCPMASASSSS